MKLHHEVELTPVDRGLVMGLTDRLDSRGAELVTVIRLSAVALVAAAFLLYLRARAE
jgi:hypothetical protein